MKRIYDRSFQYVPSHATDLRKTFEKIRREQEQERAAKAAPAANGDRQVLELKRARG